MKWFDAESKGMYGSMLDRRGRFIARDPKNGSFVGFQTGNWMPKTNLAGKKKTNLEGALNLAGAKIWHPTQN